MMKKIKFKKGDELFISATYVEKHEIIDVHVINVKMARGAPTQGIDLLVSNDVILTANKED